MTGRADLTPPRRRVPRLEDITLADIPPEVGLFPLPGALLLPRGKLPLNVFEARYRALVDDALASSRLIGMVQPSREEDDSDGESPGLFAIGCLGRITSFTERADGTYALALTGIARFRILREDKLRCGYRVARIDSSSFIGDLMEPDVPSFDRARLLDALRGYFARRGLSARWSLIDDMDDMSLLTTLPMMSPFDVLEKQALLEAPTLDDRVRALHTMLDAPA
ncbi:Lon-like ATP-dependent protease La [Ameyamaea chiangmaiensis NBRC 103196]|uniref:LON peptidase substrate-binding domain-containing protein n=1 Tax=Ameyamaea chiangmaiensis TaxID=442969 RepID=A0A850P7G7_9PROT|nr:LON peptidase substrate-binding domain-containing protein [Ameyamaea chiangmaiensis]MBS4075375.1 LON peptidase substrate-binding domain-containing protein [Ameyamaea chiangmaiensis]NVN39864.1 LON peptidase substrate-binding domain-containing protein [Ameyamaea chiangmaiensis]GBQ69985.1 Lon-like ATP-dependent protease La [Ameyamaea chiangmaiensis NBRC 103196]